MTKNKLAEKSFGSFVSRNAKETLTDRELESVAGGDIVNQGTGTFHVTPKKSQPDAD